MKSILSITFILLCVFIAHGQTVPRVAMNGNGPPPAGVGVCRSGQVTYRNNLTGEGFECVNNTWQLEPAVTVVMANSALSAANITQDTTHRFATDAQIAAWNTGGAAAWGTIIGTLSAQTDLNNALNLKANTSSLAPVATSGIYADLTGKPTIPAAQVQSDWNAGSGMGQILNKPTLAASATTDTTTTANITDTASKRFTADAEKSIWNAKQPALGFTAVPDTRTVNGQPLSANVTISTITGNAGSATALETPRTINGVSFNGTANITIPVSGYRALITLGADVPSTAAITFQNIPGLSFAVTAGTNYRFYAIILYTTSAATIGVRVSLAGPAVTHLAYTTRTGLSATGSAAAAWQNYQSTVDAGTVSTSSISTTAGNIIVLEGIIRPSANGTVQLRFSPETATANGVIVKAGSTLEVW